jgi:hypothetical protein
MKPASEKMTLRYLCPVKGWMYKSKASKGILEITTIKQIVSIP